MKKYILTEEDKEVVLVLLRNRSYSKARNYLNQLKEIKELERIKEKEVQNIIAEIRNNTIGRMITETDIEAVLYKHFKINKEEKKK